MPGAWLTLAPVSGRVKWLNSTYRGNLSANLDFVKRVLSSREYQILGLMQAEPIVTVRFSPRAERDITCIL